MERRWFISSVKRPDAGLVEFKYDALGRRYEKKYKDTVTKFVWDGNTPLHEWNNQEVKEESNWTGVRMAADTGLTTWVFDADSFVPSAKIQGDKSYSIISDYLGTPQEAYSQNGVKVWGIEYESYGKTTNIAGQANFIPFRFQGQYYDVETELSYNRFRYYDAENSSYISQDPIRVNGGLELYSYVHNTTGLTDPFGLDAYGPNQDVYALYKKGDVVNGVPKPGAEPYYVGISQDSDVRLAQHTESGKFNPKTDTKVDLHENIDYAKARALEQKNIEKYDLVKKGKTDLRSNQQNSFRHNRTDARGKAFEAEYKKLH